MKLTFTSASVSAANLSPLSTSRVDVAMIAEAGSPFSSIIASPTYNAS